MSHLTSLNLLRLGDPEHAQLRETARAIARFDDPDLQAFIDAMLETVGAADGVGLAAPQVGRSLQLLVVASRPNPRYPDAPLMEPTVMANPRILQTSGAIAYGWEGCLSVPDRRGWIPRDRQIEVDYCDRWGNRQRRSFHGFIARIFQHEFDHLHGILFPDRAERPQDLVSEARYWQLQDSGSADSRPLT